MAVVGRRGGLALAGTPAFRENLGLNRREPDRPGGGCGRNVSGAEAVAGTFPGRRLWPECYRGGVHVFREDFRPGRPGSHPR